MFKILLRVVPLFVVGAMVNAVSVWAADPPRPVDPPAVRTAPAAAPAPAVQEYRIKNILGAKITINSDYSIGTVDDIVMTDDGQVEYLIVSNQGKLITVPWSAAKFNIEKKMATVTLTQEQYKAIPTYTVDQYPVFFEPTYRARVYGYYGLTPWEIRRIERHR